MLKSVLWLISPYILSRNAVPKLTLLQVSCTRTCMYIRIAIHFVILFLPTSWATDSFHFKALASACMASFLHPQPCIRNATELCVFSMFSVESHSCELFRSCTCQPSHSIGNSVSLLSESVSNNQLPRYYVASVTLMHLG